MKTIDKVLGLCVVAVNGAVGLVKTFPGVTIVTLATIAVIARMAYIAGIVKGQGL